MSASNTTLQAIHDHIDNIPRDANRDTLDDALNHVIQMCRDALFVTQEDEGLQEAIKEFEANNRDHFGWDGYHVEDVVRFASTFLAAYRQAVPDPTEEPA